MNQTPIPLSTSSEKKSSSDHIILMAAKGGGIAFIGNFFVYVIRFAFGVVLARMLGAELLGLYSLGMTFADIAGSIALLGLTAGVARYVPISVTQKDNARLWGTIQIGVVIPSIVGLILAIATSISANLISYRIYDQPALVPILRVISWAIPLQALMGVLSATTQGFKRMEYKVYSEDVTLNVLKLLLTVVFVGVGFGVMGAVSAYIISMACTVVMLFIFVHKLFPLNNFRQEVKRNYREMFNFTLPIYISQLVNNFSDGISTLVLGFFGTVSGVGVFTAALRVSAIGTLFHSSLMRIAIPMISDLHSQGKISQLQKMYQVMTKWGMAFNLPVFLTTAIFAQPLLSIFGRDFVSGSAGMIILAGSALFNASTGVCGTIVTMTGHSRISLANSIISLAVTIGLDLVFIPRWGLVGAAAATALSVILLNILRLIQIYVLLKIQPYNRSFIKPIVAALIASLVTLVANQWLDALPSLANLAIGAVILWGVYAATILLLKLDSEDRLVLQRFWSRINPR